MRLLCLPVVVPCLELMQEEQSERDTSEEHYTRGGKVWEVHGPWDEDVDFTFGPEVISAIPEDGVGSRGSLRKKFRELALRMRILRSWADSQVTEGSRS